MTERIGILGGTFNPIHNGHLILAQDALEQLELDEVIFIPCSTPPHKGPEDIAPASDRLAMVEAAIEGDLRFSVNPLEIDRGGPSWTVDTLRELHRRQPGAEFFFLIGADILLDLHSWYDVNTLFGLCRFAVTARPGFPSNRTALDLSLTEEQAKLLSTVHIQGHTIHISSTEIRMRIAEGLSVRYLVPDAVAMYIAEHQLYMLSRQGDY